MNRGRFWSWLGLIAVSPDGEYQPWLAKQVPTIPNGDVKVLLNGKMDVTYRLLAGVTWSDGRPFTSDDVRFTWQFVMKEPTVFSRDGYDRIESIDVPDATTGGRDDLRLGRRELVRAQVTG